MVQGLRATEIGTEARALLKWPERRWAVLASVGGAIYLESERQEILWLAASRLALHGRAILVDRLPSELSLQGAPCRVRGQRLCVGVDLEVDLESAAPWRPTLPSRSDGGVSDWGNRLITGVRRVARHSVPRGSFIHAVLHGPSNADASSCQETQFSKAARRGVPVLGSAGLRGNLPEVLERAIGLVGLGEGLTPSGDDLLGGFLFTLRVLDTASKSSLGIDWRRVEVWLSRVRPLTGRISFAVLVDHARGEASEPLQTLLHEAITGSPMRQLVRTASRVGLIGHSSGWDMLGGVFCGGSVAMRMTATSLDEVIPAFSEADRAAASSRCGCRKEAVRVW